MIQIQCQCYLFKDLPKRKLVEDILGKPSIKKEKKYENFQGGVGGGQGQFHTFFIHFCICPESSRNAKKS